MWYPIPKPILFDLYLFSGIKFVPNVHVGHDISAEHLYENNDAVLLCMGATRPRDLPIANRESTGIFDLNDLKWISLNIEYLIANSTK